jgi:hypothetical protein
MNSERIGNNLVVSGSYTAGAGAGENMHLRWRIPRNMKVMIVAATAEQDSGGNRDVSVNVSPEFVGATPDQTTLEGLTKIRLIAGDAVATGDWTNLDLSVVGEVVLGPTGFIDIQCNVNVASKTLSAMLILSVVEEWDMDVSR